MDAHLDAALSPVSRARVAPRPSDADALLAQLLAGPAEAPAAPPARSPWAAPARLTPARARQAAPARLAAARGSCAAGPAWPTALSAARGPAVAAATVLLAAGILASSIGAVPAVAANIPSPADARAARVAPSDPMLAGARVAPSDPTLAGARVAPSDPMLAGARVAPSDPMLVGARVAPAGGALASLRVAPAASSDAALLARLLAAPTAADTTLLSDLLAGPAGEPAAIPAFELAAEPAAPAVPAVSFSTVTRLPSTAFNYSPAAVALPAVTDDEVRRNYAVVPPPPPPAPAPGQQGQPPAPAGYVQPPGYQDGVPFGGQIGAVPGSRPATPSRPSRPAQPSRPAVNVTYSVRAGDTLSSIALRYYGDARYAATIWEYNYRLIGANPNAIFPGQRLVLPGVRGTPAVGAPLPVRGPIGQRANYTIQPRDFLRWMAQRAYGNEMLWPEIYHANRNVLGPNPDLIYPNVTVYIP